MTITDIEDEDLDPLLSTAEIIEETRRPLLIERHRDLIEEMESSLSDALITGTADNPRLATILKELEADSEQQRLQQTLSALADDDHFQDLDLQQAAIEHLCLLRERMGIEVATLQIHLIGLYRRIRDLIAAQHSLVPSLDDLRRLPARRIARLLNPIVALFGSQHLGDAMVICPPQQERAIATIRRISKAIGGDHDWDDAVDPITLERSDEEPFLELPEGQRAAARQRLIADRIRSRFYRQVFLAYFDRDSLADEEIAAHKTILHWLESIEETPHLYPFMQGQTQSQKIWRLANLLRKVLQLNEIYQRVAIAADHPSYREPFVGLDTRERLRILAKDRYPALPMTSDFAMATMLCPFDIFARWVQDRLEEQDFVLPPEPKRRP